MSKLEKVYRVQFAKYNYMKNAVSTNSEIGEKKVLDVGRFGFLVRESKLDYYRQYGDGYVSIELVGEIEVEDNDR